MSDVSIKLHEALKKYGSFPTLPVGMKMVKSVLGCSHHPKSLQFITIQSYLYIKAICDMNI
jgi:hypothetical protein